MKIREICTQVWLPLALYDGEKSLAGGMMALLYCMLRVGLHDLTDYQPQGIKTPLTEKR